MADPAAGVLRFGDRDAAHVPHGLYREPQPALTGQRQLGPAAVPVADEPGSTLDPLGRAQAGGDHQPGILHPGHWHRRQQQITGIAGLCRRPVRLQRIDHRHDPCIVRHGAQPPGAAAVPAPGRRQYLPLAEVDPPRLDRRHHHGRVWLLSTARCRAGSGQPGHRRLCRHLAIPSRRFVGTVLANG
ncbi:hypothetical protein D9M71_208990 [compost metagenome]